MVPMLHLALDWDIPVYYNIIYTQNTIDMKVNVIHYFSILAKKLILIKQIII